MPSLPLDRILQSQGFGTRKFCRQLIEDGEVSIDGEAVLDDRLRGQTEEIGHA